MSCNITEPIGTTAFGSQHVSIVALIKLGAIAPEFQPFLNVPLQFTRLAI